MAGEKDEIDICRIVDDHRFNRYTITTVAICFLVVLFEGYDIAAMAFALPGLAKDWKIENVNVFGPVLSSSIIGMMIGSALFGFLGDRMGRRVVIIGSCLIFALFTGLIVRASSLHQLALLRLLAGIGLGGAAPNAIALTSEIAPLRNRSFAVTVMYSGIGLGGALPGLAAALLVPLHGWQSLFVLGCILPLAVSLLCSVWLPESPSYLVLSGRRKDALPILRRLAPAETRHLEADQLALAGRSDRASRGFAALFDADLAWPTILFWVATIGNFMTYFVLLNWSPTLFTMAHIASMAAIGQTVFQFGGVAGGLIVGRLLDRSGPAVMAAFALSSALPTAAIGIIGGSSVIALLLAEFLAGVCILGTAYGFGALAAIIYPTGIRSNGAGCALGAGRFGSVVSTILAGRLVAGGVSLSEIFLIAAVPLGVSGVACLALARRPSQRPGAVFATHDAPQTN